MSLLRYRRYKSTGIDWLGEVPEHWQNQTLSARFSIELGKMLDESRITGRHLLPYLRNVDVQWDTINFEGLPQMDITDAERRRYTIQNGDLLVCEGGQSGRAAIVANTPGVIGFQKALHRLRPRDHSEDPKFMYYTLAWASATGVFSVGGSSTIAHLTGEQLRRYRFPKPPLEEQLTISAFLDRETAKLDALVAEQQRLIELLKEKRRAVISHTVMKGLKPAAPMKDSGIAWLGQVPAHWDIKRLGAVSDLIQTGPFGSQLHSEDYIEDATPVINPSNIRDGQIIPDLACTVGSIIAERLNHHRLKEGDIVFARRGEMGRCARVSAKEAGWLCGTGSITVRLNGSAISEFVSIYLGTPFVRDLLRLESVGSTMDNLNTSILSRIPIPVPPADEQAKIAAFLDLQTGKLEALTMEAQTAITVLQERRVALIAAAVTGRIDVRRLPTTAREKETAA